MCGIAGAIGFNNGQFKADREYLGRMATAMAHRGPDAEDLWVGRLGQVGLVHRRLSIIDLSDQASQPMANEDGSLQIVFNGEIYNHAELRAELESLGGHTWRTDHSDTEVLLHGYEQWGPELLNRLRGMFAFALWDEREDELWMVRDRLGIKPLYYSLHHGRLTFASEIKALLTDRDQQRALDETAFYHYLSFLTTPAPQTLFKGIKKLPAGGWLKVDLTGRVSQGRWWDLWDHAGPFLPSDSGEVAEALLEELRTSVNLRKVSDVPVGVFLSGGIDSSTNAVLFSESEGKPISTFSIGYDQEYGTYRNELPFARQIAKQVGANHHERLIDLDDLIRFLPSMVHLQDEPIADPVCVPVYYVSELARQNGVIVCQVGEGADELFWGYPRWKAMLKLQQANAWPVPGFVKRLGLAGLKMAGKGDSEYCEFLRRGVEGLPIFWGGAEAFGESHKKRLLSPRLRKDLAGLSSWQALEPIHQRFMEGAWEKSILNWMSYLDLNLRLPELLLMRVDKMSMGVSLEARVPFLDHKFVEMAMSIPAAMKTSGGELKYILKKAVGGLIPDNIIQRRKQGFNVPVYEWFFGRLGNLISRELLEFTRDTGLFDPSEVKLLIDRKRGPQLWYLFNFALWWRHYIAGEDLSGQLANWLDTRPGA
jgi:asparagine synthase (glutamine-hydrolysing)